MLNRKVPFYSLLITVLATNILTYFLFFNLRQGSRHDDTGSYEAQAASLHDDEHSQCTFNISRLKGYQYIHPLIFAEPSCETESLLPVKETIIDKINSLKASGVIRNASVYLRLFNKGEWISVEDQEKYSPGSLLKVPELITIMKMNEKNPGVLKTRITFEQPLQTNKTATYVTKSIQVGKSYTVKELLYYMIAYSDNNATYLLNKFMDIPTFKKVFTDLGLPEPDMTVSEYKISARDYSVFMKVLYNGSYLSIEDSEFCTELLSKCDFRSGMLTGLPDSCRVAHKFGEGGDARTQTFHLSESGLVYCDNKTYLVTIMTNGSDMKALPGVIGSLTNLIYQQMESYYRTGG